MKRRSSVLIIFLTVFIDLIGFGIVVPLVPIYGEDYGASGFLNGAIIASFSAMQFLFAPIWGRLSDRHGRRPILLISTLGAAFSYVLFALGSQIEHASTALFVIFLSRAFAGVCGGNITVAQAYIADITPPQDRSKKMGLIGMAFGLGFIFGPVIGGVGSKYLGHSGPGWLAAALCASNFLLALFILGESRQPSSEAARPRPRLSQWGHTLSQPKIGLLIGIFFLATFCFSCFECTLALLVSKNFNLSSAKDDPQVATTVYSLFIYCGLMGAFVQGGAIGNLVKKFGEPKIIALSLFLTGISFFLLPFIKGDGPLFWSQLFQSSSWTWEKLLLALALLSLGSSLTRPPLFGMLSNLTSADEQGATIGVAQSFGSLARILGPLFALPVFERISYVPYVVCGIISFIAGVVIVQRLQASNPIPTTDQAPAG